VIELYIPGHILKPIVNENNLKQAKEALKALSSTEAQKLGYFLNLREKYELLYGIRPGDDTFKAIQERHVHKNPLNLAQVLESLIPSQQEIVHAAFDLISARPGLMYANKNMLAMFSPSRTSPKRHTFKELRKKPLSALLTSHGDILKILNKLTPKQQRVLFALRRIEREHPALAGLTYEQLHLATPRPSGEYHEQTTVIDVDKAEDRRATSNIPQEAISQLSDNERRALFDGKQLEQNHHRLTFVKDFGEYVNFSLLNEDTAAREDSASPEPRNTVDLRSPSSSSSSSVRQYESFVVSAPSRELRSQSLPSSPKSSADNTGGTRLSPTANKD